MATLTPKELAKELDTDPRTVRKFLRSKASGLNADAPGKGGRWAIESKKVRGLKGKFSKWMELEVLARNAAKAAADTEVIDDAPEVEEITEDEVEVLELTEG
ncbi:MAG: hypothetical protein ACRD8U_04520 [Pyrinomonadaceae bacterium]